MSPNTPTHSVMPSDRRTLLAAMFDAAVKAAQPEHCIAPYLPRAPKGKTVVLGAGKASAAMARAFEQQWQGPLTGLVVTRYGYAVPCQHIEIVEAAHPVPDQAGRDAATRMLALAQSLGPDDLVVCLVSGGGSSLLPLPGKGISLQDKQDINRALLKSGATISEMNCVRRHLSAIKGGRLAAACHPAKVVNLLISDVPGDNAADIASGPTVADASTCADALELARRYQITLPDNVRQHLESGDGETIKPDDARLANVTTHFIATPQMALTAAANVATQAGLHTLILGDSLEGEARDMGKVLAGIALQAKTHHQPVAPPCVLLSGGESTVTVRGHGRGGRNVEFLLSLALTLRGANGIYAMAGDTDGVDGQEEIAGAFATPDTLVRALAQNMRARDYLDNNDGHGFFEALGDSLVTGPTHTNVNDFRAIMVT